MHHSSVITHDIVSQRLLQTEKLLSVKITDEIIMQDQTATTTITMNIYHQSRTYVGPDTRYSDVTKRTFQNVFQTDPLLVKKRFQTGFG